MINFENIEALSALGAKLKDLLMKDTFVANSPLAKHYWWERSTVSLAVSLQEDIRNEATLSVELIHPKARPMPCCRIRFELNAARVTAVQFDLKVLCNKSGPQPADLLQPLLIVLSELDYS